MRLRLFDRIRRLVRTRPPEAAGNQGRHRRDQRRVAAYDPSLGPGGGPDPDRTSGLLTRSAASAPDGRSTAGPSRSPGASSLPSPRASGSPAVRVGGARARVREAPAEATPRSTANWKTGPPAELAHAEEAIATDSHAEAL